MAEVRVATFNVENLFARFKFKSNIDPDQAVRDGWNAEETAFDISSPDAKRITGAAIKATEADIIALQEVENLDTLKRFRSEYLGGSRAYRYALAIDGNDPRLIDVAVLSKHPWSMPAPTPTCATGTARSSRATASRSMSWLARSG